MVTYHEFFHQKKIFHVKLVAKWPTNDTPRRSETGEESWSANQFPYVVAQFAATPSPFPAHHSIP